MKIETLKPGMTVWSVTRGKMGNTTMSTVRVYGVRIASVDLESRTVMASWNNNEVQRWHERQWSKWRKDQPVTIPSMGGFKKRLATRAEVKAMKEQTP